MAKVFTFCTSLKVHTYFCNETKQIRDAQYVFFKADTNKFFWRPIPITKNIFIMLNLDSPVVCAHLKVRNIIRKLVQTNLSIDHFILQNKNQEQFFFQRSAFFFQKLFQSCWVVCTMLLWVSVGFAFTSGCRWADNVGYVSSTQRVHDIYKQLPACPALFYLFK